MERKLKCNVQKIVRAALTHTHVSIPPHFFNQHEMVYETSAIDI